MCSNRKIPRLAFLSVLQWNSNQPFSSSCCSAKSAPLPVMSLLPTCVCVLSRFIYSHTNTCSSPHTPRLKNNNMNDICGALMRSHRIKRDISSDGSENQLWKLLIFILSPPCFAYSRSVLSLIHEKKSYIKRERERDA